MKLSPIERKAKFAYAVTMRGTSKTAAADNDLGVSWTHLSLVIDEEREGSEELKRKFAEYIGVPYEDAWPQPVAV